MLVCGLALRAGAASAQTPPALPEPWPEAAPAIAPPPPEVLPTRWYGWQTLTADASAVGMLGLALALDDGSGYSSGPPALVLASLGTIVFGGPAIHAAHGHWSKAGFSLALRLGAPLLGWAVGFGLGQEPCGQYMYDHEGCATGYAAIGALFGLVTAVALDAALLGREQVRASSRQQPTVGFTPLRGGGGLSLSTRF